MHLRLFRWVTLVAIALAVPACSSIGNKPTFPCPKVFVLGDAGNLVRFKPGPGRDITDILFEARIANFTGSCEYDEGGFDVDLLVSIDVQRGPASRGREIGFEYFVAVPSMRPDPEGKRVLPVTGRFEGTQTRLVYQDELNLFLPVSDPTQGANLEVVIGFQLSPDEIEFNRSIRQR